MHVRFPELQTYASQIGHGTGMQCGFLDQQHSTTGWRYKTLSPRAIMTGHPITSKSIEFQFGDFVRATDQVKTSNSKNTMHKRTSNVIYCRPSGNHQGSFWVSKLSTAQLVHRNSARPAHISDAVAKQM